MYHVAGHVAGLIALASFFLSAAITVIKKVRGRSRFLRLLFFKQHHRLGYATGLLALAHTNKQFVNLKFSFGYIGLFLLTVVIVSGVLLKYKNRPYCIRLVHLFSVIIASAVIILHIFDVG